MFSALRDLSPKSLIALISNLNPPIPTNLVKMAESLILHVKSKDGKTFQIEENVARHSTVFQEMLQHVGMLNEKKATEEEPFPCDCEATVLEKALEWLKQHKDDTEIPDEDDYAFKEKEMDDWDTKFFKDLSVEDICELLIVANYLNTKSLMVHTAKALAGQMSGKSTEEMRQFVLTIDEIKDAVNAAAAAEGTTLPKMK